MSIGFGFQSSDKNGRIVLLDRRDGNIEIGENNIDM